ncbi:hypothetical protein SG34_029145 [Thalassomonas viridans]|uniref:Aspartate/glutamate/uridylate kinase domain-containing protein n=1 Tax=Thalassomonas viridans TaxID=137584 RepID=A0AAF0C7H4_9GAMM|nr:hypothetical protein [Thalassomonas viridans]WDE05307.1 hypothetical protein SG34_029145 [Thalassomonas viridans]
MLVVMKFGGASLGCIDSILRVVEIVRRQQQKSKVLVVVSGCGGVTDQLTRLLSLSPGEAQAQAVEALHQQHISLSLQLARTLHAEAEFIPVLSAIRYWFEQLEHFLTDVESYYQQIITLGERLSAQLMLGVFKACSLGPGYFDATQGIRVYREQGELVPDYQQMQQLCREICSDCHDLRVTEGFIGLDEGRQLVNLGRNGSDWSAALFAIACNAVRLEIWKEVHGLYSADPRVVEAPELIPHIAFSDLCILAQIGAAVIHAPALAALSDHRLTLELKCTLDPAHDGTRIHFCGMRPAVTVITSLNGVHLEQHDNRLDIYCRDKASTELRLISSEARLTEAQPEHCFYYQGIETSLISVFDNSRLPAPEQIRQTLFDQGIACQCLSVDKFPHSRCLIVARDQVVEALRLLHTKLVMQQAGFHILEEQA